MIEQEALNSYLGTTNTKYDSSAFDKCPEFTYGEEKFVVCSQEGADIMVQSYRDALWYDAHKFIANNYEGIIDYVDFESYAEDSFQSIYDIYDNVVEYKYNNKTYYICWI